MSLRKTLSHLIQPSTGKRAQRRRASKKAFNRRLFMESLEDRRLLTTTVFYDGFESGSVGSANWPNDLKSFNQRPVAASEQVSNISSSGPIAPAGVYAAQMVPSAGSFGISMGMQSRAIDLSSYKSATVTLSIEAEGHYSKSFVGGTLDVQYLNQAGIWVVLHSDNSTTVSHNSFTTRTLNLPADAIHSNFRISIVGYPLEGRSTYGRQIFPADAWFIDDVIISAENNKLPTIHSVTSNGPVLETQPVTISVSATDPDPLDQLSYSFDFDNDGVYDITNTTGTATHVYPDDGAYQVNVRVDDGFGGIRTGSTVVTVNNAPPKIDSVSNNGPVFQGSPVGISISAHDIAGARDPLTYLFDFDNDGVFEVASTNGSTVHTFFESGTHHVDVAVRDDEGAITTASTNVTVLSATPPADNPTDLPSVSFTSGYRTASETNGTIELVARLSRATESDVTVPLAYSGTATRSADYLGPASIVVPAGKLTATVNIELLDDSVAEGNETIIVRMQPPVGANLSTYAADPIVQTIVIPANDAPIVTFASVNQEATEGATVPAQVTLRLSNPATGRVVIPLTYSGTAISGIDFEALPNAVEIAAGADSTAIDIDLLDDLIAESLERLNIRLGQPYVVMPDGSTHIALLGATSSFSLDIRDNDTPQVSFAETTKSVWEDEGVVTITVKMSTISTQDVTVPLQTVDLSKADNSVQALAGEDYIIYSDVIIIPAGQTSASTTLLVIDDNKNDGYASEKLRLSLGEPTNAALAVREVHYVDVVVKDYIYISSGGFFGGGWADNGSHIETYEVLGGTTVYNLQIWDDDPQVQLLGANSELNEWGSASDVATIKLSFPTNKNVTVPLTYAGTATPGVDYYSGPKSVTIPSGEVSATIRLTPIDDNLVEPVIETIIVRALTPTNAILKYASTHSIAFLRTDDVANATFEESGSTVAENVGTTSVKVKLSQPLSFDTKVYIWSDHSALPIATVEFPSGTTSKELIFTIPNNNLPNPDVVLGFKLRASDVLVGAIDQYRLTILNDDLPAILETTTAVPPSVTGESAGVTGASAGNLAVLTMPGPVTKVDGSSNVTSTTPLPVATSGTLGLFFGSGSQLSKGTLFFDANKNLVRDAGEVSSTTALDGSALLTIPQEFDLNGDGIIDPSEGQLVLVGSIDAATGVSLSGTLVAPAGSYVISPLTTLVAALVDRQLENSEAPNNFKAGLRVLESMNLPIVELAFYDPTAQAAAGDPDGARIYAGQAKLYNTVKQVAAVVAGLNNAPPRSALENLVFADIAAKITEPHSLLDLGNEVVIDAIIRGVLNTTGLAAPDHVLTGASTVIAAGNSYVDQIPATADIAYMNAIAQVKKVSQGDIATELMLAALGAKDISTIVAANTGESLAARFVGVTIGNVVAPEIRVSDAAVKEGDDGTTWAEFTVSLNRETRIPVKIDISTSDYLATSADGDYVPATETLVWNPGDALEKIFRVQINGDSTFEPDEEFSVVLSHPENAVVRDYLGIGLIVNDEALTYTAPADGVGSELVLNFDGNSVFLERNGEPVLFSVLSDTPITINTLPGVQNSLTIRNSNGATFPLNGLSFVGSGSDVLIIQQDQLAQTLVHTYAGNSGVLDIDGALISYRGVGSIVDSVAAYERRFAVTGLDSHDIVIADNADPMDGSSRITNLEAEASLAIDFVNPLTSLIVQCGDGEDTIRLAALDSWWSADVHIDTGRGNDSITIEAITGDGRFTVDGGLGNDVYHPINVTLAAVTNVAANVSLGIDLSVEEGENFARSGSFSDPGNDIWSATVNYGDGSGNQPLVLSPDQTFVLNHTYADNGYFKIIVTISDEDGDSGTASITALVNNVSPQNLTIAGLASTVEGGSVSLTASATDPAGPADPLAYTWTITRNGSTFLQTSGNSIDFEVPDNEPYVATVTVNDGDGGHASRSQTISVTNAVPTATFSNSGTITYGETDTVSFSSQFDVSSADTAAGFHYAYSLTGDFSGISYANGSSTSSSFDFAGLEAGSHTLFGRIIDKDNGYSEYSTTVTVEKAMATIVVTPYSVTFEANSHTAEATAIGVGGEDLSARLTLSGTTHIDAGIYNGDSWSFDGGINYFDASGTINNVINKANAIVTVNGYAGTYDAAAHGATGSVAGVAGDLLAIGTSLDLGISFTDAPGGSAKWTFYGGTNYNDQVGSVDVVIEKADATITINGYTGTYDASAYGATGSVLGVAGDASAAGSKFDLGTNFTDAPGGTASWTFIGGTNYIDQSGSVDIEINKANAVVTVNGYTGIYDATAHGATGSVTGVAGDSAAAGSALDLGLQFTNAPGGSASWTFIGGTNYIDQSGSVDIEINKANAVVTVNGYTGIYDATAHGATGSVTGVAGDLAAAGSALDLGLQFTNAPGGTANWTFTGGTNYNDQNGSVAIVIDKAVATINVNGYTGIYDATAHGATGSAVGVNGEALAGLNLGASFTNVPGGTADWTFTDVTGNYLDANGSVAIVIDKAVATINVSGTTVTYDGTAHGATGSAVGVSGETLSGLNLGASFTNAPGGTANWAFTDATGNYLDASDSVAIVIDKALATINVNGTTVTYDGNAHGASGSATGVTGETLAGLDLGASFTNAPGGTANWAFTDVTGNYLDASGSVAIVIGQRAVTVTANHQSKVYGANDPLLTYAVTSGSLAANDDFFGELARESGEAVGTYAISQGSLSLNDEFENYDLSFVDAELAITHAILTGDATTQDALNTAKQGKLNITVSNITGFVNGENAAVFLSNASFWITINDERYEFVPASITLLSDSSISISYTLKNSELQASLATALESATSGATAIEAGFMMESTNYRLSDDYLSRLFSTIQR